MQSVSIPTSKDAKPANYRNSATGIIDNLIDGSNPPVFKLLSYADDLEVFLSSPQEWPILQDLLKLYGSASNAKVNINKTEIVSLSGRKLNLWSNITDRHSISYHTNQSNNAVRYLGYPLYSTQAQLLSFLLPVKKKIRRHCNLLSTRGLSVRGSSLLVNSVILSTLWHLLRVVPIPVKWLNDIRTIVRKFVLSFWPAPSWKRICFPKSQGGLSIIDIDMQQHALKMVFLQRLLKKKSRNDFVSPLIGHIIFLYTGHYSFLPWLLYPELYLPLLKKCPTVSSLTSLLKKLPPLKIHVHWSGRWLADLPLSRALLWIDSTPSDRQPFSINKIPLRHLVSDVVGWSPYYGCFVNFLNSSLPLWS